MDEEERRLSKLEETVSTVLNRVRCLHEAELFHTAQKRREEARGLKIPFFWITTTIMMGMLLALYYRPDLFNQKTLDAVSPNIALLKLWYKDCYRCEKAAPLLFCAMTFLDLLLWVGDSVKSVLIKLIFVYSLSQGLLG